MRFVRIVNISRVLQIFDKIFNFFFYPIAGNNVSALYQVIVFFKISHSNSANLDNRSSAADVSFCRSCHKIIFKSA